MVLYRPPNVERDGRILPGTKLSCPLLIFFLFVKIPTSFCEQDIVLHSKHRKRMAEDGRDGWLWTIPQLYPGTVNEAITYLI